MKMVTVTRNHEGLKTSLSPWILTSGFKLLNTKMINTKSKGIKNSSQSIISRQKTYFSELDWLSVFWFNVGKVPPCLVLALLSWLDLLGLALSSMFCGPTFLPAAPSLSVQPWSLLVRITFSLVPERSNRSPFVFKLWCTIWQSCLHSFPFHCPQALAFYLYSYPTSLYGGWFTHSMFRKTKSTSPMFGMK